MTILNRDQLHGIRQNIFKLGLCEKAKMPRLYIKTQQRNAVNKHRCLGTATWDKCKMTHASPGPISSLIKMEHKFSVSRTKILLLQRWFLTNGTSSHPPRPCWLDWQAQPMSPSCTRVQCRDYTSLHSLLPQLQKQLVPWISWEVEISALMTSCN